MKNWMKKVLPAVLLALGLVFSEGRSAEAKTHTYTEEKHKKVLDTIAKYSTIHYILKSETRVGKAKPVSRTYQEVILDTKSKLAYTKTMLDDSETQSTAFIYDLKNNNVHFMPGVKAENADGSVRPGEELGGIKAEDTTDGIAEKLLKLVKITTGIKGRDRANGELYFEKTKRPNGAVIAKAYKLNKGKNGYLPRKAVLVALTKQDGKSLKLRLEVEFKKFSNERVALPKKRK